MSQREKSTINSSPKTLQNGGTRYKTENGSGSDDRPLLNGQRSLMASHSSETPSADSYPSASLLSAGDREKVEPLRDTDNADTGSPSRHTSHPLLGSSRSQYPPAAVCSDRRNDGLSKKASFFQTNIVTLVQRMLEKKTKTETRENGTAHGLPNLSALNVNTPRNEDPTAEFNAYEAYKGDIIVPIIEDTGSFYDKTTGMYARVSDRERESFGDEPSGARSSLSDLLNGRSNEPPRQKPKIRIWWDDWKVNALLGIFWLFFLRKFHICIVLYAFFTRPLTASSFSLIYFYPPADELVRYEEPIPSANIVQLVAHIPSPVSP